MTQFKFDVIKILLYIKKKILFFTKKHCSSYKYGEHCMCPVK